MVQIAADQQQEEQADRAGVNFLNQTGQSPKGMYDTFKRLGTDTLFAARGADPYLQSHPMPAERVAALEGLARPSPYWDKKDAPELQLRHDMMRAKISAFMERQDTVYRRYPLSAPSSDSAGSTGFPHLSLSRFLGWPLLRLWVGLGMGLGLVRSVVVELMG